jgi:N-acetylglucosaminyldiphosphoundecaprenol N-acetyl-beta-D-mannosaminyltransferase
LTITRTATTRTRPVWVWGLPLAPLTSADVVDRVDELIRAGVPSYFITANVHYAMLTARAARLADVNRKAAFVVADGMPLVWASRWLRTPLPERVTGVDLLPALCERAALRGHRVFFLGGAPGVAEAAAERLCERFPALQIVGVESPPYRQLSPEERQQQHDRIRAARPDLLFVAFGQPKGEYWIDENCEALGVPVSVQVGASLDFVAGRVLRAPRWVQRVGLEWAYRLWREPSRLAVRYLHNGLFALAMCARTLIGLGRGPRARGDETS